jgi:hypothetical protein
MGDRSWIRGLAGALVAAAAVAAAAPPRTAAAPLGAIARADSSRIEAIVRLLSQDASGAPVSRYAERPETRLVYAPRVQALLDSFLTAPDGARLVPFASTRTDTAQANVVGVRTSRGRSAGLVLLTGHLDSTGRRTSGWLGLQDPAPGADDNASGVAAIVEGARAFACGLRPCDDTSPPEELPFDLGFVAFGAEEAFGPASSSPLEGSRVFARALEDSGVPLLGVFNCDMIAYNPDFRKVDIVANASSAWISDLFKETAKNVAPDLEVVQIFSETSFNSDHASFWSHGEDAVTLIENRFPDQSGPHYPGNPFYHTSDDTAGNLNYGLAADVASALFATVGRLAVAPEGPPDLHVDEPHIVVTPRRVFVGDRPSVEVRVYNRGGAMAEGSGEALVRVWRGAPNAGRLLAEEAIDLPIVPWFYKRAVISWDVRGEDAGIDDLSVEVTAPQLQESNLANNGASRSVTVLRNDLSGLKAVSNPMTLSSSPEDLRFEFEVPLRLTVPQEIEAAIYDVSGRRVAHHPREGAQDGKNFLLWSNFAFASGEGVASGVYLVEVRLIDRASGAVASAARARFAVLR